MGPFVSIRLTLERASVAFQVHLRLKCNFNKYPMGIDPKFTARPAVTGDVSISFGSLFLFCIYYNLPIVGLVVKHFLGAGSGSIDDVVNQIFSDSRSDK